MFSSPSGEHYEGSWCMNLKEGSQIKICSGPGVHKS